MVKKGNKSRADRNGPAAVAEHEPAKNQTAYFLSLEVENVRCFGPKQILDLSYEDGHPAQWTVILGDNGVGKTTLLQCLAVLVLECVDRRASAFEGRKNSWNRVATFSEMLREKAETRFDGSGRATSIPSRLFRHEQLSIMGRLFSSPDIGSSEGVDAGNVQVSAHLSAGFSSSANDFARDALRCYGYGAARRMGESQLTERAPLGATQHFLAVASLFDDDAALLNAEEWLLQADYSASKESPVQERVARRREHIRAILIDILPDVEDIVFTIPTESEPNPGVRFRTPYGLVSLEALSLGYRTLIAWTVDFASRMFDRYPESPNPLAEPAIVLVDEIDLHLHPKWQRSLIGFLSERFPNTQFIVTAHSPLVVQAASDANVVLLRREGDHVIIDNDVEKVRNWRVDQVLTSDLFGLESARPPEIDRLLARRTELLSKGRLTAMDRSELREVERQIGPLPAGDTLKDAEAMDVIHRAAEFLKNKAQ